MQQTKKKKKKEKKTTKKKKEGKLKNKEKKAHFPVRQTTRKDVSPSFYVSIRGSTYRVSRKCKIDKSFDISNQFLQNWPFFREFVKETFSKNWKEK